jgi:hypothetical protein
MSRQLSANEQRQLQARKTVELQAIYRASLTAGGFVDASGQVRPITRTRDPERTNVCLHCGAFLPLNRTRHVSRPKLYCDNYCSKTKEFMLPSR